MGNTIGEWTHASNEELLATKIREWGWKGSCIVYILKEGVQIDGVCSHTYLSFLVRLVLSVCLGSCGLAEVESVEWKRLPSGGAPCLCEDPWGRHLSWPESLESCIEPICALSSSSEYRNSGRLRTSLHLLPSQSSSCSNRAWVAYAPVRGSRSALG
jgi:hypothetical protein